MSHSLPRCRPRVTRLIGIAVVACFSWATQQAAHAQPPPVELTLTKSSPFSLRVNVRLLLADNAVQVTIHGGEVEFPASAKIEGRLLAMQAYLYGPTTDTGKERVVLAFSSPVRYDRVMLPGTQFQLPRTTLLIPLNASRVKRIEDCYVALGFTYKMRRTLGQETFVATPDNIFKSPTAAPGPSPAVGTAVH
jgi:hypothetical protein